MVTPLKQNEKLEINSSTRSFRPWGYYEILHQGKGFQIKYIVVKPDASLSLQMHHHRDEHWIVKSGIAKVICDDKELTLSKNETIYIPKKSKHRLTNTDNKNLEIIEIQFGSYLGEDDIVRFEDNYGRV